jgi:single-stranded-DNA-specific exonuclease
VITKRWKIAEAESGDSVCLAQESSRSPLFCRLLEKRGVVDADGAERFVRPRLTHLCDPFELPGMERAVDRIEQAILSRESIAIFGDYDVDGISSTCLLYDFFRFINYPVKYRIPNRLVDGYGVRPDNIRELVDEGVKLIITVDNGSSANLAAELASQSGVDLVITDHHQLPPVLPHAVALVNPWLPGSEYPFKDLAGVGVVFKLTWALSQRFSRQRKLSDEFRAFLLDSLALVALGTISDVVPLLGENRILAKFGLRALEETKRPGLKQLVESVRRAGEDGKLDASHVGFRMGPRINAAGRLGRAETAIELLLCQDDAKARELARTLDSENRRRREIEREMHEAARELVRRDVNLQQARAIVLGAEDWHAGVIGIVAARIAEEFSRPTLLLSIEEERARGSARSIPGVHICNALSACAQHLIGFGGHEMAAGVEMSPHRIGELREALNQAIAVRPDDMIPELEVDGEARLADLTRELLQELSLLEPHGSGNPRPLLVAHGVEVVGQPRVLGEAGRHLSFHIRQDGVTLRAIAFNKGELFPSVERPGTRLSVLFWPKISTWKGRSEVELEVSDLKLD